VPLPTPSPLPVSSAPPPHADPFAPRLPEQLDRQVGVGIGDDILHRPANAVGPIGWTQHRGERALPVHDRVVRAEPGDAVTNPRFHYIHEPLPALHHVKLTDGKAGRIGNIAHSGGKARHFDRALARQRHPHRGARARYLAERPQRVVDTMTRPPSADDETVACADP
jgi:hypothetical protein